MRSLRRRYARVLVVLSLLMLALPATGIPARAAQQTPAPGATGTQVVPGCDPTQATCNTYEFGGGWVTDPDTSMTGAGGYFAVEHQVLAETAFQYFETPWGPNHVTDNAGLMEGWAVSLLAMIGQVAPVPVATGTLADGTLWHLYAVPFGEIPFGMLFTADTADPSQHDVTTMLTSPASTYDQAIAAVQADIRVNGTSPLAGIDPAQALAALGGAAPVTPAPGTTPVAGTTPATGTTPGAPPTPTTPGISLDQSAIVGSDTIAYGGEWTLDPANSSLEIATFQTTLDPRIVFSYGQGPDRISGGDAQLAIPILDPPTAFDAVNAQQLASEVLPSGRAYALYTWDRAGAAEVALFVVDVTATPGTVRMQILFAPPDLFVSSLTSVQQSFLINGEAPFAELDPSTLATLIGGGTAVTPTAGPTPATVPTPTPGSGGLVLPPLGGTTTPAAAPTPTPATVPTPTPAMVPTPTPALVPTPTTATTGQTITVAGAVITYNDQWLLDTVNSTADGATYFDAADGSISFVGYYPTQPASGDAATQLESVTAQYFQNIGATDVQRLALQALSPTSAWALTTARQSGLPIAVLTYADTATTGQLRIQMLYSQQAADLAAHLANAQGGIQIDGVPAFAGVDPAAVTALLGGAPPTPTPGTGSAGSVVDYQARDAPTGCDGIGWVITDPGQAPVSQADRDYRGACVGGGAYTASCGSYELESTPLVLCTVDVTVTGAPMTVSVDQFTLVDGSGTSYEVDLEALTVMVFVLGTAELPEASVSPGTTVSGTLLFAVPREAPGPWVVQVAPETIATTGEAPGTLVIDGALQPVDLSIS